MSALSILIKKVLYQFQKLKRSRWERFQNSHRQFIVYNLNKSIKIRLYKDSFLSEEIYQNKFENAEINFIRDFLVRGDIFVDIGANIGLFSLIAAKKIGKKGRVYSFEPVKKTYNRLTENIDINHFTNIFPIEKAISDKTGEFQMNISTEGFDAWNSFAPLIRGTKSMKEIVETIKLDDFFKNETIWNKISLLKIDVEGWEKFVIQGGIHLLSKENCPVLFIEFVDQNTKNAGYSCKDLYFQLKSLGFEIYGINGNSIQQELPKDYYEYSNLIATKDIKIIKQRLGFANKWSIN